MTTCQQLADRHISIDHLCPVAKWTRKLLTMPCSSAFLFLRSDLYPRFRLFKTYYFRLFYLQIYNIYFGERKTLEAVSRLSEIFLGSSGSFGKPTILNYLRIILPTLQICFNMQERKHNLSVQQEPARRSLTSNHVVNPQIQLCQQQTLQSARQMPLAQILVL